MTNKKVQSSNVFNGKTEKVTVEQFGNEFSAILEAFENELNDQVKKDVREAAKLARKEVKKPPAGAGRYHDWGRANSEEDETYASGWRYKVETDRYGLFEVRVYNSKKPGLTHLLEKGHLNRDGKTRARAFPHIAPAADKAFKELERRMKGGT